MSSCRINAETAANALAPALAQPTNLVKLRLDDNHLEPSGAQRLVPTDRHRQDKTGACLERPSPPAQSWPLFLQTWAPRLHGRCARPQGQGRHACAFG